MKKSLLIVILLSIALFGCENPNTPKKAFTIILNGHTYTDADFSGYGYRTAFPNVINDMIITMASFTGGVSSDCTSTQIDGHLATALTTTQLSLCRNATVTNYGQAASEVIVTLPTATLNLGFTAIVGTTRSNYWRFAAAGGATHINLDGVDTRLYVQYATPTKGDFFSCVTYQVGASTWNWRCTTGAGITNSN